MYCGIRRPISRFCQRQQQELRYNGQRARFPPPSNQLNGTSITCVVPTTHMGGQVIATTILLPATMVTFHHFLDVAPHLRTLIVPVPAVLGHLLMQKAVVPGGRTANTTVINDPPSRLPRSQITVRINNSTSFALIDTGSSIFVLSLYLY